MRNFDAIYFTKFAPAADLVFPETFLGDWDVVTILTNIETPLGPDYVQASSRAWTASRPQAGRPGLYPAHMICMSLVSP